MANIENLMQSIFGRKSKNEIGNKPIADNKHSHSENAEDVTPEMTTEDNNNIHDSKTTTNMVTIYYPPKKWLEQRAKDLDRLNSKADLERKYSYIFKMMQRDNVKVDLKSIENENKDTVQDREFAQRLINLFFYDSSAKLKLDWARIYALLESDSRNMTDLIDFALYPTAPAMLKKLARLHCITIYQAWRELGNKYKLKGEARFYSYYYNPSPPKQWSESLTTKNLSMVVQYAYGAEKIEGSNPYRADKIFYLLPNSELIVWNYLQKYGEKDKLIVVDNIEENLIIYEGKDFISQIPIFEGLKTSGVIKPGATKVPISVAKKISSLMVLKPLPRLEFTINDRFSILANLGAYAKIEDKKSKTLSIRELAELFLLAMFDKIHIKDEKSIKYFMEESIPKVSKRILDNIQYKAETMAGIARELLGNMPEINGVGQWVRYDNVIDWLECKEASVTSLINWAGDSTSSIELPNEYLYYPDYYGRLKMPVMDGLLQMFASIGLIDFAYENIDEINQEIRYVRITNAGLWIAKRVNTLNVEIQKVDDGLVFDPDTLMITIRDTNSPNYALLEDLTERLSDRRYRVTEAALLKGCKTKKELMSRIDRLKNYLLDGADSVKLDMLISVINSKVNAVKPTKDIDYYCMDIDPNDKELHSLIMSDNLIRKNTLRVEGWKLLVRKGFYPNFLDRLRQSGYLTES